MTNFDRRGFLKIGAIAPWCYLSWGDVLRAQGKPKKDISVIHLFLQGGLSQMDSFDPKPEADSKYRSVFKSIPTKLPGIHFSEHLPLTAKQLDKFVLIRSMTHKKSAHGEAVMELLGELHSAGATICMVTHDPRYAAYADRTVHLFDGRVVEEVSRAA